MISETTFIVLFCVATTVALAVRRFRVPYTVALVLAGLGLGAAQLIAAPHLTKELLFAVFLPGLLFEAAFHLKAERLRENTKSILLLAVPGVVAAIAVTGAMTAWSVRGLSVDLTFTLSHGLVFGALIAATDPIAVIALFRSLHVPSRLALLVEGESLLNDGTAVVFFSLILGVIVGGSFNLQSVLGQFVGTTVGGAAIGAVIGLAASHLTRRVEEPMIEISLTVIAAYGAFVAAEHVHASGVIATVASGLVYGNVGGKVGMSPATHLAVVSFWEYVAFALNSIVFLLIGFEVSVGSLAQYWREIVVALVAMLLARIGVVALVALMLRRSLEALPRGWTMVLAWGGIRGGLSIVLALGLPRDLPHREQLVTMTLGVVLSSILLQGMTMAPLLRRLGLVRATPERTAYEQARADLRVSAAIVGEIRAMRERHLISDRDVEALSAPYEARRATAEGRLAELIGTEDGAGDRVGAQRHLLAIEASILSDDLRDGRISQLVYDEVARDLAARRLSLESGHEPDPKAAPEKASSPPGTSAS